HLGRRLADQDGNGVLEFRTCDRHVSQLDSRRLELRVGERDVGLRDDAALVAIPGQLQVLLEGLQRGLQYAPVGVDAPELEVVDRQLRLVEQGRVLEIRR